jgi:hypothetical protein
VLDTANPGGPEERSVESHAVLYVHPRSLLVLRKAD